MELRPIGIIHTPFKEPVNMPIQPAGAEGIEGTVEIFEEYQPGLKDLEGFSHIILVYEFDRCDGFNMQVIPFMDKVPRGVFSTRAPRRPNRIGLSVVQLNGIDDGILRIERVDMLDETPLLDIKPYVPEFDQQYDVRTGWLEELRKTVGSRESDDRFSRESENG